MAAADARLVFYACAGVTALASLSWLFLVISIGPPADHMPWAEFKTRIVFFGIVYSDYVNPNSLCGAGQCVKVGPTDGDLGQACAVGMAFSVIAILALSVCVASGGYTAYTLYSVSALSAEPDRNKLNKALLAAMASSTTAAVAGLLAFSGFAGVVNRLSDSAEQVTFGSGFALCIVATLLSAAVAGLSFYARKLTARSASLRMTRTNGLSSVSSSNDGLVDSNVGAMAAIIPSAHGGEAPAVYETAQQGAIVRLPRKSTKPPTDGAYTYDLCAEDVDGALCCCTCCAYHYMVAKAAGDIQGTYFDWFMFAVASCMAPCIAGWFLRSSVQRKYGIREEPLVTMCVACCCPLCATLQDIREADVHGDWDPVYGVVGADGKVVPNAYTSDLCACTDDPESCILVCCGCHPYAMGKAGGEVDGGPFDFILCCVALFCPLVAMVMLRLRVRRAFQLGERWTDSLERMLCCTGPCAICQDVREVNTRRGRKAGVTIDTRATLSSYAPAQPQTAPAPAAISAQPVAQPQPYGVPPPQYIPLHVVNAPQQAYAPMAQQQPQYAPQGVGGNAAQLYYAPQGPMPQSYYAPQGQPQPLPQHAPQGLQLVGNAAPQQYVMVAAPQQQAAPQGQQVVAAPQQYVLQYAQPGANVPPEQSTFGNASQQQNAPQVQQPVGNPIPLQYVLQYAQPSGNVPPQQFVAQSSVGDAAQQQYVPQQYYVIALPSGSAPLPQFAPLQQQFAQPAADVPQTAQQPAIQQLFAQPAGSAPSSQIVSQPSADAVESQFVQYAVLDFQQPRNAALQNAQQQPNAPQGQSGEPTSPYVLQVPSDGQQVSGVFSVSQPGIASPQDAQPQGVAEGTQ